MPKTDQDTEAPRLIRPAAAALGQAISRAWSAAPAQSRRRGPDMAVPMSDGTVLRADHYLPVTDRQVATVLVRSPYGRGFPYNVSSAQLIVERGFHVLLQSCRGTFGSGGDFDPMRHEAADGQDTVAWLRRQHWFDGRLATYGLSYLGFVQWALAQDPPPELVAAVIQVGPHDFSRAAYHHGTFDLQNFLGWSDMVAHQETARALSGLWRMATADRRLRPALNGLPVTASGRDLLGTGAPWFEGWLEHPDLADPFWAPLQCGAALERIAVPTLLVGGWQDLFLEQTLEQYQVLGGRGVPTRMLVGPWTHVEVATKGGAAMTESLAWLDRYAGLGVTATGGAPDTSTRPRAPCGSGSAGKGHGTGWRGVSGWPPAGPREQRWYLAPARQPDRQRPGGRRDPARPVPLRPGRPHPLGRRRHHDPDRGVRDNRALEARADVLVFTSEPLAGPVEILGEVAAELSVARDNPHADLFVRLCDVDKKGRSRNVCDGIVRLTAADPGDGVVRVSLLGAAHRFGPGHRLRLQVSGGAHPRFARNPGTGQVEARAQDLVPTAYQIHLGASALLLPVTG